MILCMLFTRSLAVAYDIFGMWKSIVLASTLQFQCSEAKNIMSVQVLEEIDPKEKYTTNQGTPYMVWVL